MSDPKASFELFDQDFGAWLEANGCAIPDAQFRRKPLEPESEHRMRLDNLRQFDAKVDLNHMYVAIKILMMGAEKNGEG